MFLGFGEIMLRIVPDGFERLRQALPGKVNATFGGGEANVCVSLANYGLSARYLTALPDNSITQALLGELRNFGVDTSRVLMRPSGRLGIYFLETGANQRGSNVVYDRDATAIAAAGPDEYDWDAILDGVTWVHVTGITPSLSENAFLSTLELCRRAKAAGATVSCDLNFRKKLWKWRPGTAQADLARECMSQVLNFVDVVVANEEDADKVLGIKAEGTSVESGKINAKAYGSVARRVAEMFPDVSKVAITLRESYSATHNNWGGMLYDAKADKAFFAPLDGEGSYQPYEIRNIVDRVGGGDSFAGGLIYALNSDDFAAPEMAIRFAVAASCLKHSVLGDFNCVSVKEVAALVGGQASGRVSR
jgi:2-dehydro-3-deoxygluconokinase